MAKKFPKVNRAKLIANGGFYSYINLPAGVTAKIIVPIMRKISIVEPFHDYSENWHFELEFTLEKVGKRHAEYRQTNIVKVKALIVPTDKK